ncbi:hypothetical protein PR202_gb22486 [Eleusine coracana subsp. coracana]|uniref:Uncharacterized protein n=1 Tax=Eleusine coracana subsp. coracana TaxID=191504 RepID=A0AAV5FGG1_ELECO|nr:hypothetical protein PR202_gb22486 [Eleusine coracana subsp. coracana]
MEQRRVQQCISKGGNKHPPPLPPPRRARDEHRRQTSSGSFSASLLDAIYRSLDEGDDVDAAPRRRSEEKAAAPPQFWWEAAGVKPRQQQQQVAGGAERRPRREAAGLAAARPRHSGYASSTASSSDSSSASSFSCSSASTTDTESTVVRRRRRHGPPDPPRVSEESPVAAAEGADVAAAQQPKGKRKSKSRPCFPGARFRPKSPSQSSPGPKQPPSPATFACALKALFTSATRRQGKKPKTPSVVAPQPVPISPPAQTQTDPSAASKVKAAVVTEPPTERSVGFRPEVVRRRVEELVRGLEELEEDDEGSDSSSDLFELESLRGAGAGADELPVYGTTSLAANRAIAQKAAC